MGINIYIVSGITNYNERVELPVLQPVGIEIVFKSNTDYEFLLISNKLLTTKFALPLNVFNSEVNGISLNGKIGIELNDKIAELQTTLNEIKDKFNNHTHSSDNTPIETNQQIQY